MSSSLIDMIRQNRGRAVSPSSVQNDFEFRLSFDDGLVGVFRFTGEQVRDRVDYIQIVIRILNSECFDSKRGVVSASCVSSTFGSGSVENLAVLDITNGGTVTPEQLFEWAAGNVSMPAELSTSGFSRNDRGMLVRSSPRDPVSANLTSPQLRDRGQVLSWANAILPDGENKNRVIQNIQQFPETHLFDQSRFALLLFFNGCEFFKIEDSWIDLWAAD